MYSRQIFLVEPSERSLIEILSREADECWGQGLSCSPEISSFRSWHEAGFEPNADTVLHPSFGLLWNLNEHGSAFKSESSSSGFKGAPIGKSKLLWGGCGSCLLGGRASIVLLLYSMQSRDCRRAPLLVRVRWSAVISVCVWPCCCAGHILLLMLIKHLSASAGFSSVKMQDILLSKKFVLLDSQCIFFKGCQQTLLCAVSEVQRVAEVPRRRGDAGHEVLLPCPNCLLTQFANYFVLI